MIRRRAFTSRLAAALALPGCGPRVPSPASPLAGSGEPLWYDPFPDSEHMNVAAALQQAPDAFAEEQSRIAAVPGSELAWSTAVEHTPERLVAGPKCVAACGETTCRLIGSSGELEGETPWARRGAVLDERGSHIVVGSEREGPAVFRIPSGARAGVLGGWGGHEVEDLQRWGGFHLVVTIEPPRLHSRAPSRAGVQLLYLRNLWMRQRGGQVEPIGIRRVGQLVSPYTELVQAVGTRRGLVLATERGVQWTDWALRPGAVWRGAMQPERLSGDDDGFVGLVAVRERERELLLLDGSGQLCAEVALRSPGSGEPPPLISGKGVFVVAPPGELLAYDRDGAVAWHFSRNGASPPVSLGDLGLAIEHAGELWHCTWAGQARPIAVLPAPLTAAPVAYAGSWYVASQGAVHRLG